MAFQRTTAINKILRMTKRIRVIQGGTWAGKTYGIMAVIADYAAKNEGRFITVVAESIPAIKRGALSNFMEIMMITGRWIESHYNYSERIYTFANGSKVEFNSFESVGKAQAAGKRTDLFLNEAYYLNFEIADALIGRTTGLIWIDYNPHALFWVHDELLKRGDVEFIKLIPSDNECVPDTIKAEHRIKRERALTSEYWSNWCRVFLDGETGRLMGTIFTNWHPGEFDKSLPAIHGMDFGFNDPDVLIKFAFNRKAKIIYIHQLIYSSGNSAETLRELMKPVVSRNDLIVADCADARMINELKRYFNMTPANKKMWTVAESIKMLQDYEFVITEESLDVITEFKNYVWNDKRAGLPIDAYNHAIDCIRYAFNYTISKSKSTQKWHG